MIYLEGLESVIESVYLNDPVSDKVGECKVLVNPENIKYLTGRTIILTGNKPYPEEKITKLLDNGCKIISRVYTENPNIEVQPYILRLCFDIMWNGRVINSCLDVPDLFNSEEILYKSGVLYFPKIYDPRILVQDNYGNLNCIGWALQQVGINIKKDTPFTNLDILKTGKIIL